MSENYYEWTTVGLLHDCNTDLIASLQNTVNEIGSRPRRLSISLTVQNGFACVFMECRGDYAQFTSAPVTDRAALEWLGKYAAEDLCGWKSAPASVRFWGFSEYGPEPYDSESSYIDEETGWEEYMNQGWSYLFGGPPPNPSKERCSERLAPFEADEGWVGVTDEPHLGTREAHQSHCCDTDCGGCA